MSVLERVRIIEGFLKKISENFVGTLETVRNREVSVPRGSTVFTVTIYLIFETFFGDYYDYILLRYIFS